MSQNPDLWLYIVHEAFWTAFGITLLVLRMLDRGRVAAPAGAIASEGAHVAPRSRALVAFHAVAFGIMYFGIGHAVLRMRVPFWFRGQRVVASVVVGLGALLVVSALVHFRSWRFRAQLDKGHELATGGPFRILRHPVYMGLDLLALGSAIWAPTVTLWIAALWMAIGGDLRARAEERILEQAFGAAYQHYRRRTSRFVPGIY